MRLASSLEASQRVEAWDGGELRALLTQDQVALLLNVSPRTLEAWRYHGKGPQYIRLSSRCIRYSVDGLRTWLETVAPATRDNVSP